MLGDFRCAVICYRCNFGGFPVRDGGCHLWVL